MGEESRAYRYTLWMSRRECLTWYLHFHDRGIPVALVERIASGTFSVWRIGNEHLESWREKEEFNPEEMRIDTCGNGFAIPNMEGA